REQLTPFKRRWHADSPRPSVTGADKINEVLTFDDDYVSQFVFQPDEVLKNSFEIFIDTEEYRAGMESIETIFESLKKTFSEQEEFNDAVKSFEYLLETFKVTQDGFVAKSSKGYKAVAIGARLQNVPKELHGYKNFLHS